MKKILFILSVAVLALVSCNKEQGAGAADGPEFIQFSAGGDAIVAETRAPSTEVTTNSIMHLYVTAVTQSSSYGGTSDNAVSNFVNVDFSRTDYNQPLKNADKVWPGSDPLWRFYGCNVANMVQNNSGGARIVLSNQNSEPSTDIVAGYISSPSYKQSNQFQLSHIYCQLGTVTLTAPSGYTVGNLKLYFRPMYNGTYNLRSSSWSGTSAVSSDVYVIGTSVSNGGVSISTAGGSYNSGDKNMWMIPGTYSMTATYTITKGEYTSPTITRTANNINLIQGRNNNITGTLTDGGQGASDLEFTVTVQPWTDNGITGVSF